MLSPREVMETDDSPLPALQSIKPPVKTFERHMPIPWYAQNAVADNRARSGAVPMALYLLKAARCAPWHFHGCPISCTGLLHNTRPPLHELGGHLPIGFAGPRLLQYKNRQAILALHLALSALLFSEPIAGNYCPAGSTLLTNSGQPFHIGRTGIKLFCQMHHFADLPRFKAIISQPRNCSCPTWRQVGIKNEIQCTIRLRDCSNRMAA